jgi:hypothetical protein
MGSYLHTNNALEEKRFKVTERLECYYNTAERKETYENNFWAKAHKQYKTIF